MILLSRSLPPETLLLWDSGFRSFDLLTLACGQGAHVEGSLAQESVAALLGTPQRWYLSGQSGLRLQVGVRTPHDGARQ